MITRGFAMKMGTGASGLVLKDRKGIFRIWTLHFTVPVQNWKKQNAKVLCPKCTPVSINQSLCYMYVKTCELSIADTPLGLL